MRSTNLMTLYQPLPCIASLEPYITICEVKNHPENRLTRTYGNVNLTDLWFEMIETSCSCARGYVAQHFNLLCDIENHEELYKFWKSGDQRFVLISLIKVNRGHGEQSPEYIKTRLTEGAKDCRFFRTLDNADIILVWFADTLEEIDDTRKKLQDSEKESYYSFYSVEGFFNIIKSNESVYCKVENLSIPDDVILLKNDAEEQKWCAEIMQRLHKEMEKYAVQRNKKWVSYYQTIYQIINLLSQYEQSEKLKDLFYVLFPSLRLFFTQLKQGRTLIEECKEEKYNVSQTVETSVSEFIDAMENLIHHTGISCLNLLNSDGRNGLAYDISIRMCLMYLSVLHVMSHLLNDTEYEYQFLLSLLTYSSPTTKVVDFNLLPEDRLIKIQLSRHQFYSPRALIGILAHECGHYVGCHTRVRNKRAEAFINIAATILEETLLPESILRSLITECNLNEKEIHIFVTDWKSRKIEMRGYFRKRMGEEIKRKNKDREHKYHFRELYKDICQSVHKILYDEEKRLVIYCNVISEGLRKELKKGNEKLMKALREEFRIFQERIMEALTSESISQSLYEVQKVFKEIYSDLGAILLLKMDAADYLEAYLVSESYLPDTDVINTMLINRLAIVHHFASIDDEWKEAWDAIDKDTWKHDNRFLYELKISVDKYMQGYNNYIQDCSVQNNGYDELLEQYQQVIEENSIEYYISDSEAERDELFNPLTEPSVIRTEIDYFEKAFRGLKTTVEKTDFCEMKQCLRSLYSHFKVMEKNKESSYKELFDDCDKIIDIYRNSVKNEWDNWSNRA